MKIFLIGFMGCGKTTLGSKLALKLGYTFFDLDKVIENLTGMTIAKYFELHGEATFRDVERETLTNTSFPENSIISTGGGAPCFFNNMEWMNENGTTIYISMSPKSLATRLKNGKNERPLIRNLSPDELVDFIANKLEEREVFYKQAELVIEGLDITAEKVIAKLGPYLK